MLKAISFKTAAVIVVGLHGLALLGFTQWSSFKAKIAKTEREEKKQELLERSPKTKNDWPTAQPKTVAASTPKPQTTPIPKSSIAKTTPPKVIPTPTPLTKTAQEFLAAKSDHLKETIVNSQQQLEQATKAVQQIVNTVQTKKPTSKPIYTKETTRTYNSDGTYEDETVEVIIQQHPSNRGQYIPIVSSNRSSSSSITITPVY